MLTFDDIDDIDARAVDNKRRIIKDVDQYNKVGCIGQSPKVRRPNFNEPAIMG